MNLYENFNSCKQKFGIELTEKMYKSGIQERYLLSACRFNITNHISIDRLVNDFKEWNSYVIKYQPTLDVNTISYERFLQLISQAKLKHCLPNPVVITNRGVLGRLDTVKDARKVPVETTWCIKARSKFESILRQGDELYAIYLPYEKSPYTFTIALIQKGNVAYFDSNNHRQFEMDEPSMNAHATFQAKIPKEIINYLYDRAATQTESMESNKFDNISDNIIYKNNLIEKFNIANPMKTNKKVVRLTESDLYKIIEGAVKQVLKEGFGKEWNYGNDNEWDDEDYTFEENCLKFLRKNGYNEDAVKKVVNHMYANDCWVLKDDKNEILCLATDQNGNLMYSLNQRGWKKAV